MKLGIDFGTTRIVVAAADRGNYPVVEFEAPDGGVYDWFPPLVAAKDGQLRFGWDAWRSQAEPEWTVVRSAKRLLSQAGINTRLEIAGETYPLLEILSGIAAGLHHAIRAESNLTVSPAEPLEAMLGVPAHSNSNQRFLTAEAFRAGGFQIAGLMNEPSAASIEFGHSYRTRTAPQETSCILVYDFGGGTFDASLVELDATAHTVLATEGIDTLGGDDFDEILAGLALDAAAIGDDDRENISQAEWFLLHEECRRKKEALNPNSRRITIELDLIRPDWTPAAVSAQQFYDSASPLVVETLRTVEDLLEGQALGQRAEAGSATRLEAVYLIGGASELPSIPRLLRERFGRRLKRSSHARSATAIGLAIQADAAAGYRPRDQFTRYFGVWRESEGGSLALFDPLFEKGLPLPGPGEPPLEIARRYHPAHNVGHFRYLECSRLGPDGSPEGDITEWDQILFPFDVSLEEIEDLHRIPVARHDGLSPSEVEERYYCESGGTLRVDIENLTTGHVRHFRLARWTQQSLPVKPGRAHKARAKRA